MNAWDALWPRGVFCVCMIILCHALLSSIWMDITASVVHYVGSMTGVESVIWILWCSLRACSVLMRDAFKPFSSVVRFSVISQIHDDLKIMNSFFFSNNKCALPYLTIVILCYRSFIFSLLGTIAVTSVLLFMFFFFFFSPLFFCKTNKRAYEFSCVCLLVVLILTIKNTIVSFNML